MLKAGVALNETSQPVTAPKVLLAGASDSTSPGLHSLNVPL